MKSYLNNAILGGVIPFCIQTMSRKTRRGARSVFKYVSTPSQKSDALIGRMRIGISLILLQNGCALAQPIQLIPRNGGENVEQSQADTSPSVTQPLPEFWEGTPPSVIETYFPKLPLKLTSPTLRKLRTQLIKEKYPDLVQKTSYDNAIFSLLQEEGEWEQAKEFLIEIAPPEKEARLLDLQWLTGDSRKACEKITNLMRTSSNAEWKKQNIYCLYLNGEEERAKIALEVLSESSPATTQLFNTLFDSSLKPPFDDLIATSPFLLTVWLESQQEIPEGALNKLSSSYLVLIARSEKAPFPTRLLAAEKALTQGTFKAVDFLTLLNEAPETGLWGQLVQELKSPKTPNLLPLFERAEQEGKLELIGQVFSSSLSSLEPSLETLPLAPFMIRAFLGGEEKELAKKWGAFFMREAPDEAIPTVPLLHLAFPETKWGESQIQAWQAYESRVHPKDAAQRSYGLRRILQALVEPSGEPMEGEPSSPSWRQEKALFDEKEASLLDSAASSKRKGEVILLVLGMIGETPLHDLPLDKLVFILKALYTAGYREESRLLALEALEAKGL